VTQALIERPRVEPVSMFADAGRHVHSRTRIESGYAFSQQWLFIPGGVVPTGRELEALLRDMDRAYYGWIQRVTGGTVGMIPQGGGGLAARVVPIGPVGLVLGPARVRGGETARSILSGVLVGGESGELAQGVQSVAGGAVAYVDLRQFRARLLAFGAPGRLLYMRAQSVAHRWLSNAFLRNDVAPRLRVSA
jgi:hypothetical protein